MIITHCYWQLDKKTGTWPGTDNHQETSQLPAMMKRRLTPLGRQAIEMLYKHITQAEIPWIISCQHADAIRKVRLLSSIAKKELISPTDFSLSVHNAIIGIFSIATQNKQMHTAITGSDASFETGLLEALALQIDKKCTVGYIYYDAFLPKQLIEIDAEDYPITCIAMIFSEQKNAQALQISYTKNEKSVADPQPNKIKAFVDYLESDEQIHTISTSGGNIFLARVGL
jgi:hypothetical protein